MTTGNLPWMAKAQCRTVEKEVFYDPAKTTEAKSICKHCPVRKECLEFALEDDAKRSFDYSVIFGVWGGMTARERCDLGLSRSRSGRQRVGPKRKLPEGYRCGFCARKLWFYDRWGDVPEFCSSDCERTSERLTQNERQGT